MKNVIIVGVAVLSLSSCLSKKSSANADKLPKDIALKPENNLSQQQDRENLNFYIKEIDSLANSEICNDASDFSFAAIGAKPCGGPSSYIAYPKKLESEILPKIEKFTAMQVTFNKKYQMISDCMMVMPPSEIVCQEGKAVLIGSGSSNAEVQ